MTKKAFSKSLFAENDGVARAAGMLHLMAREQVLSIQNNPKKFEVDLLYTYLPNGTQGMLEVEVKKVWKGGKFPYPSVQVLGRKRKYFCLGADILLLAQNFQDYAIIGHGDILASPTKLVPNRFVAQGEEFFDVPLDKIAFKSFDKPVDMAAVFCCAAPKLLRSSDKEPHSWECLECYGVKL